MITMKIRYILGECRSCAPAVALFKMNVQQTITEVNVHMQSCIDYT